MRFKEFLLLESSVRYFGSYTAEGPFEDGIYSIQRREGYKYSSNLRILKRAAYFLMQEGYVVFDKNKNKLNTEIIHHLKDEDLGEPYYVRPSSPLADMYDGDNEEMAAKLKNVHVRVPSEKVFEDIDRLFYEAEYVERNPDDGDTMYESVEEFTVKKDDFEITGPDDDGMWNVKIKNAGIKTADQRDALRWHFSVMTGIVRFILWTDIDEDISIFSPAFPSFLGFGSDGFQITKVNHIPDYPVHLRFRPSSIFPDMIDDNATRKSLLKRVALSKAAFMNMKLESFLKEAIKNAKSEYDDYMNPMDDIDF